MSADVNLPYTLIELFNYIDENHSRFVENLRDAVEIQSVASMPCKRQDTIYMVQWMADQMGLLGIEVEILELGNEEVPDNTTIKYPPVIFGTLGTDVEKKTLLVFCHLDVAPASLSEGWDSDPFTLVEDRGKLYGRGTSDDKGPALGWLHAIEAYVYTDTPLPVNIKLIYTGLEETVDCKLQELLKSQESFLQGVDFVCVADTTWLGTRTPCISYGLRGYCSFCIEIQCAKKDLHSGVHGGIMQEAMSDMMHLLNRLVDSNGHVLIPGLYEDVEPVTWQEERLYMGIDFDVEDYKKQTGCYKVIDEDKVKFLMANWRFPCLSIHGIQGAVSGEGWKSAIPNKVTGKFSVRLVPNQDPRKIQELVMNYLDELWKKRGSSNQFRTYLSGSAKPWTSTINNENYKAAWRASKYVYGIDPDMIRQGDSTALVVLLQELTRKNVIMLPMGSGDDGSNAQNEKIDIRNFIGGTKLFAAYMLEVAQ